MDLKVEFSTQKPREKAGAIASGRFEFQKNISLSMLLNYEEGGHRDYVFIFDFHEDLVIMDAEASPEEISFYQIKGKRQEIGLCARSPKLSLMLKTNHFCLHWENYTIVEKSSKRKQKN